MPAPVRPRPGEQPIAEVNMGSASQERDAGPGILAENSTEARLNLCSVRDSAARACENAPQERESEQTMNRSRTTDESA
jgi:hypothetical protein